MTLLNKERRGGELVLKTFSFKKSFFKKLFITIINKKKLEYN